MTITLAEMSRGKGMIPVTEIVCRYCPKTSNEVDIYLVFKAGGVEGICSDDKARMDEESFNARMQRGVDEDVEDGKAWKCSCGAYNYPAAKGVCGKCGKKEE